jgi:hypothetical protein
MPIAITPPSLPRSTSFAQLDRLLAQRGVAA